MATVLVAGAAGFIGANVCETLIRDGNQVIGVDNINDAYDARLKYWRLDRLQKLDGFQFLH
ncbi:MAG TPA: NAD-dependent epimerase/dehydratase family protein, partial [Anaerolineaceae bacterium]|nr:NAD-dependent epimerase/dehydratase family protein [Anaerolineaceae bacterium]